MRIPAFLPARPGRVAGGRKLIILGIDGMDPDLLTKFMAEGKMPNFARLAQQGSFRQADYQHSAAESGGVVEPDHGDECGWAWDL